MTTLRLNREEIRDFSVAERRVLFHVPTSSLFEIDGLGAEIVDLFAGRDEVAESDVRERFDGRRDPAEVVETLRELIGLRVIGDGRGRHPAKPVRIREFPLSTVVLNVNTGCNLSCTYCYKEDLANPAEGKRMSFETAVQGIEMLLAEARDRGSVNVVFFGGEPLTHMSMIRRVVDYAEARGRELGKRIDFSLTTNATMLTEDLIGYLDAHRFGITVSIDGPREVHDRNRRTVGDKGTYDVVAEKARLLLSRYRSRPVGARVTLTAGVTDVVGIHRHVVEELGFFEVGFAPVTAGNMAAFNLDGAELRMVFEGLKALGERYLAAALADRNIGFGNMHQLITDLSEGTSKTLPCGAGLGMVAVDNDGGVNLCHRFTGTDIPTFGNVAGGFDKAGLSSFLETAANRSGTVCDTCWIRRLCAGGCYHEAYSRYSDPMHPNDHYCALMRDWVEFGIGVYTEIMRGNPAFIERHVAPRRGNR